MDKRNRFGLDSITVEDVNELFEDNNVRAHFTLKRAKVMAALIYIDGINKKDGQNRFFVENSYLCSVANIAEKNLIKALRAFEKNGYITREAGTIERKASKYIINYPKLEEGDEITNYSSEKVSSESKKVSSESKKVSSNFDKKVSSESKKVSSKLKKVSIDIDKDIDKEKDKEEIFNIIYNIIKDNNNNLINNIKNIIKKEIENIKEKENNSSINENKEIKEVGTMRELNEQVNALQEENAKLTSRLDNCARQFKVMLKTIKELQARVYYLENKQSSTNDDKAALSTSSINLDENNEQGICDESNCSINQQPSTTVEEERKDCAEKKEDASEAISSPTTSDNDTTLTTIQQEEEKPTESKEMPSNGKEMRYIDTMTDKHYATEAEAQQDGVRPNDLYDTEVGRCLTDYTSSLSLSNDPSGVIVQDEQESASEGKEMPSMAIVEDDATQKEEKKAKKHMFFKEVTTLTDEILDDLKKNYPTNEWPNLFKIDWANHTIVSKSSRDIMGYGEESREMRYRIAMDSKEGKRLMKMVAIGVSY